MIEFLRQLSDALKPIRYGVDPTHTDFHKSLSQEPNDTTNALVYADWLDEQGQPEHADAVRQHVERFGSGAHRYAYSPEEVTPDQVGRMQATPFEWQGRPRLRLQTFVPSDLIDEYSGKPFLHQLNWVKEYPSEQARLEGARKLKGEGAHLNGWGVAPLGGIREVAEAFAANEKPVKYTLADESDFHNAVHADPAESTNALAYADWLQEHDKPAHAELLHKHVERSGTGGQAHLHQMPYNSDQNAEQRPALHTQVSLLPQFDWDKLGSNEFFRPVGWRVHLNQISPDVSRSISWETGPLSRKEADALHDRLVGEGAHHLDWGDVASGEWREPNEHFRTSEKPVKYSTIPEHDLSEDYQPNGIAFRLGSTLNKMAGQNSDAGLLAEGVARTGDHSLLKILADKLDDDGHHLKDAFDWRHAERGIAIDKALEAEINRYNVRSSGTDPQDAVRLSPHRVLNDWRFKYTRGVLSKRRALNAVRKIVPDANKDDLHASIVRLCDRVTGFPDTHPAGENQARYNAYLQQMGSPENLKDPHKYPDTRPLNKRNYAAKYRKSKEWISRKIKKLMGEGKPQKQAVAIALRMAGAPKPDQYAAWKAPVGGMVVKESPLQVAGTYVSGGSFTPDLTKLAAPTPTPTPTAPPTKKITLKTLLQRLKGKR